PNSSAAQYEVVSRCHGARRPSSRSPRVIRRVPKWRPHRCFLSICQLPGQIGVIPAPPRPALGPRPIDENGYRRDERNEVQVTRNPLLYIEGRQSGARKQCPPSRARNRQSHSKDRNPHVSSDTVRLCQDILQPARLQLQSAAPQGMQPPAAIKRWSQGQHELQWESIVLK